MFSHEIPVKGRLEFDYVDITRPKHGVHLTEFCSDSKKPRYPEPLQVKRLIRILRSCSLLEGGKNEEMATDTLNRLSSRNNNLATRNTQSSWHISTGRAAVVAQYANYGGIRLI